MTRRYLISGRVQGVGFRYFVAREATLLAVTGWTQNLPDGRVETVASGTADSLSRLEVALARGPRMAQVTTVEREDISDDVPQANSFIIK